MSLSACHRLLIFSSSAKIDDKDLGSSSFSADFLKLLYIKAPCVMPKI